MNLLQAIKGFETLFAPEDIKILEERNIFVPLVSFVLFVNFYVFNKYLMTRDLLEAKNITVYKTAQNPCPMELAL